MSFDYNTLHINILDTPGHADFSEDTYRALAAADNAVMLLDAAKGLEPQTRKLFEVCRMRGLPMFTFCNKMDRPALSPYDIMDQIETEFGLETYPILWPIGDGERFKGVLDRMENVVHLFDKAAIRGGKADVKQIPMSDPDALKAAINDDELFDKLLEDQEILEELIAPLDMERVMAGDQSPLFFGSAMTNFGVQLFLDRVRTALDGLDLHFVSICLIKQVIHVVSTFSSSIQFCEMGTKPSPRFASRKDDATKGKKATRESNKDEDDENELVPPEFEEFTGFVFKTQANLDPKHRDRLAYIRIVSGSYQKGMKVGHSRSKPGKRYNLGQALTLFGNDRESIDVAYPGDVIGINNPG